MTTKEVFGLGKGNHVPKLQALLQVHPEWREPSFLVHHDEECGIFAGKECNCDPDVELDQVDTAPS